MSKEHLDYVHQVMGHLVNKECNNYGMIGNVPVVKFFRVNSLQLWVERILKIKFATISATLKFRNASSNFYIIGH